MDRLIDFVMSAAWAIEERTFRNIVGVIDRHGRSADELDDMAALISRKQRGRKHRGYDVVGGTAVIPIHGIISKRSSMVANASEPSGTSTADVSKLLSHAMADDSVDRVLFDVDSPGGSVHGIDELAQEIYEAREHKPIIALADGMMASAAYWIASQADEVYATRGASVGSIGVFQPVIDSSRAHKNQGIEVDVIKSAAHKGTGYPGASISDDARQSIQADVDAYHELFAEAVQRGRGFDDETIEAVADGRMHVGARAEQAGLVDGIISYTKLLNNLGDEAVAEKPEEITQEEAVVVEAQSSAPEITVKVTEAPMGERAMESSKAVEQEAHAEIATTDDLIRQFPGLATELLVEGGVAERERQQAIRSMAVASQSNLVEGLIADGHDIDDARKALHEDLRGLHASRLGELRAEESVGNDDEQAEEVIEAQIDSAPEDAARKAWADPKIRARFFNNFEVFAALHARDSERAINVKDI